MKTMIELSVFKLRNACNSEHDAVLTSKRGEGRLTLIKSKK